MTPSFFISSFYLYHCHLFIFFNFKNFEHGLPQLEHPKGAKAQNVMSRPKVVKASNLERRYGQSLYHPPHQIMKTTTL